MRSDTDTSFAVDDSNSSDPAIDSYAVSLAKLFAVTFDLDSVDLDDSFLELGGDSLLGVSLMTAVEEHFHRVLSISVLLEAPTPRLLAQKILQNRMSEIGRTLIRVQSEGTPPTVLCVHGQDGESHFPFRLAEALGDNVPLHAFRAIGLEEDEVPLTSATAIASAYIGALLDSKVIGPYVVLGHCAGSTIAYEMSQQLLAAGKEVAGLVMIDPDPDEDHAPYLHRSGLALTLYQASWSKRLAGLKKALANNPKANGELRRNMTTHAIRIAIGIYVPKPYDGRTLMFTTPARKAALLNEKLGYPTFIRNLDIVNLSVEHQVMFSDGLAEIVEKTMAFIRNADPGQ